MQKILILLIGLICTSSLNAKTLFILGDSLSAGYQMPITASWPALLTTEFAKKGHNVQVINASVSGDTTAQGKQRLTQQLKQPPFDFVLIELGANDGLRGFAIPKIKANLQSMIKEIKATGAHPLLMQIFVPPNYGQRYTLQFANIYPQLSQTENVPLLPFFLPLLIDQPDKMMSDGLHPNQQAQPEIAQFMANILMPYLFPEKTP